MSLSMKYAMKKKMAKKIPKEQAPATEDPAECIPMAEGGEVGYQTEDRALDMVGKIMESRKQMYSSGGQVANDVGVAEADKEPAEYDDLVLRDDDMEGADYTGENSGDELGDDQEDKDRKDIVSRIMKSRSKKDRNPRPA